jgi:thiol:disulfide interchange protein DsbD
MTPLVTSRVTRTDLAAALALMIALMIVFVWPCGAQTPVHFTATPAGRVARGATVVAHVNSAVEPGWHVYSLTQGPGGPVAMSISLAESPEFAMRGEPSGPAPRVEFDGNFGIDVEVYEQSVTFDVPVAPTRAARSGPRQIPIRVRYQVCNASLCLPVRGETIQVPVTIVDRGAPAL